MNAKRGSSVASSLDHLFATKVIKITDISILPHDRSPTRTQIGERTSNIVRREALFRPLLHSTTSQLHYKQGARSNREGQALLLWKGMAPPLESLLSKRGKGAFQAWYLLGKMITECSTSCTQGKHRQASELLTWGRSRIFVV